MKPWEKPCDHACCKPLILAAGTPEFAEFGRWLTDTPGLRIVNRLEALVQEYLLLLHPTDKKDQARMEAHAKEWFAVHSLDEYGCWVFYPWSQTAVRLPDPEAFEAIRTARNKYKIDWQEQQLLAGKCVGVAGLSVGQSVSIALAMERSFGVLRIADFDTLELNNMNRIRTQIWNLGLPKTTIVAREIAEFDPFLEVQVWPEGINENNIDAFLQGLDLLIDECDSLDIKVLLREKARAASLPLLMDTSDRGMVDVERFDLEPERPLLHGLMDGLHSAALKGLNNEQKVPHILRMLEVEQVSLRLRASFLEVDRSLTSWPQLASSVLTGGAVTADVARRILLGAQVASGRYYVDPEEIIPGNPLKEIARLSVPPNPWPVMQSATLLRNAEVQALPTGCLPLDAETAARIVSAAVLAPSGGNIQPWHFVHERGCIFLFYDAHQGHSMLNYRHYGTWMALGAAVENAILEAAAMHIRLETEWTGHTEDPLFPVLVLYRAEGNPSHELLTELREQIPLRYTDRRKGNSKPLAEPAIQKASELVAAAGLKSFYCSSEDAREAMAEIVGQTDLLRLLDPWGYRDFIQEIRWTDAEALETGDGVDIETLELSAAEKAGLQLLRDPALMEFLGVRGLGSGLAKMGGDSIRNAGGIFGIWTQQRETDMHDWVHCGRVMERLWLYFTEAGIACQPCAPFFFLYHRMQHAQDSAYAFAPDINARLRELSELLPKACGVDIRSGTPLFMFRLFDSGLPPLKRAYRRKTIPLLTRMSGTA
jgi:molybdopterin/thiamine biosynthesis adenylyltransferase